MNRWLVGAVWAAALMTSHPAPALDVPKAGASDARVRSVAYDANNVTLINVRRGYVTRIQLAADERIEVPVTGLSARCENDADEWCIRAERGSNQIFVRPKDDATRTNMELHTDKRDYSIEFVVLPAGGADKPGSARDGMYRVVYDYPPPPRPATSPAAALLGLLDAPGPAAAGALLPPAATSSATERLKAEPPVVRNSHYTMQVLDKGEDAAPSLVFDDGRFTYFEFQGTREIPAIFAAGSDAQPMRVNWHMQPPFVVVQRTARRFTLRLGPAVVGVFNEAYDPVGSDTPTATVSPEVRRELAGDHP